MKTKIFSIVRIVIAILTFVNMFLAAYEKPTVDADAYTIYVIISVIACIGVFVYNTYKNFDVTAEGALGTKITRALKAGAIASSKVAALLEESEEEYNGGPDTDNSY